MLWEVAQYFKKKIIMTVIPAMRNLFSSFKSLVGMLIVMTVLQMLLSVICISGIENIKTQQTVLNDFTALISSSKITADGGAFGSQAVSTALSSTSIFIGALIIWGICALTVYQKITFASADRDKYIWGMYITHGAKMKKIRGMLKCELYTPHLVATGIAYPLSLFLCNLSLRDHGYSYKPSVLTLAVILVLSYVCIRLVVEYECFIIKRMSCVQMLREEDSPKSVCFPRRHSRLVRGFTPSRYAVSTFLRMRKYYISLAAIAAVPAVIWICFHVSATSEDNFLSSKINEFRIKIASGIGEEELNKLSSSELSGIDGISEVTASACYPSSKIYTHLLVDGSFFTKTEETPFLTDIYASNKLVLCANDEAFKRFTGFTASKVSEGYVTVISERGGSQYNFSKGDELLLAISRLDGSARIADENDTELLMSEVGGGYEYTKLTVTDHIYLNSGALTANGFLYADGTYFVLNEKDYKRITSLSPDETTYDIPITQISASSSLKSDASFDITVSASLLSMIPREGDTVELDGKYKLSIDLTEIPEEGDDTPQHWQKSVSERIKYCYINSVTVSGNSVTLNVTPQSIITMEYGFGPFPPVLVALGTPKISSTSTSYFPATAGDNLVITGESLEISGEIMTVHISTAITAADAGTHTILPSRALADTRDHLLLESLYADNSFYLAYADKTTCEIIGIEVPKPQSGSTVLVLPSSAVHHYNFSVGDKMRLAITLEDVFDYSENGILPQGRYDMLDEHLKRNKYQYVICHVSEIIYNDNISEPYIFVGAEDLSKIISKKAPYTALSVYIEAGIEGNNYAHIRDDLSRWATGKEYMPVVSSTGGYLEHLLRKNANYSALIMLISSIIPLIVPFIWYYPLATLHDRRKTEYKMLDAIGKKRSHVRLCFIIEGILVSLCAFLTVAILCRPAMLVFKLICNWCNLPIEFDYSALSAEVLLTAALFSAICAAVSFAVCYFMTVPKHKRIKHFRRNHGNT